MKLRLVFTGMSFLCDKKGCRYEIRHATWVASSRYPRAHDGGGGRNWPRSFDMSDARRVMAAEQKRRRRRLRNIAIAQRVSAAGNLPAAAA